MFLQWLRLARGREGQPELTVSREFSDEIGKACIEGLMPVIPLEWHADIFSHSCTYNGMSHFHRPGIVHTVECIIAVPPLQ